MGSGKTYISALRTSSVRITPSFSSLNSSFVVEKRRNASLISFSSSAVMSFSLASLDCRPFFSFEVAVAVPPPRRFGG